MPVYQLPENEIWFPTPDLFDDDVVAVGGDLSLQRLLEAYCRGIFPWYNDPGEIVWWSPKDRCVLFVDQLKISRSMRNVLNRGIFHCTFDRDFHGVIAGCREGKRVGATWLIDEMAEAYTMLYERGIAHSVEVWRGDKLVGGLYGLSIGHMFYGESMFSREANSSKVGFIFLVRHLQSLGWPVLDCQVMNDHLASLGAVTMPRMDFLGLLAEQIQQPTVVGPWTGMH